MVSISRITLASTFLRCFAVGTGYVPTADAWLRPPLYVQNLDELVQLDHKDHGLPRMVSMEAATPDVSSAAEAVVKAASGEDEQSGRFVYRPPEGSEGRYNHYDAVAR